MDNQQQNTFEYTYTAPTQEERKQIESIRKSYLPETESDLFRLQRLDKKVHSIPAAVALTLGIVGTLIFGTGLTLILEFGNTLWGIIVGAIGVVPLALAYFAHSFILKKLKQKYGAEILSLSEKLLHEQEENLHLQ